MHIAPKMQHKLLKTKDLRKLFNRQHLGEEMAQAVTECFLFGFAPRFRRCGLERVRRRNPRLLRLTCEFRVGKPLPHNLPDGSIETVSISQKGCFWYRDCCT